MKLNLGNNITGLEITTLNCEKNLAYFQTCRIVGGFKGKLNCLQGCFRQIGETFKLVNPEDKDQVSVCNGSSVLPCQSVGPKYVNSVFICNSTKFLIHNCCDLPNDGKQKQVKATEIYLLWIFCKKSHQAICDQYRRETIKQFFQCYLKVKKRKITKTINIEVANELFTKK